jgi:HTH-type transcriptional regulator/antitoxin HigA
MIRPIKNRKDYDAAVARIETLMDAKTGTPEADELEVLSTLVDLYEDQHFPIDLPTPIDAIRFRMDQQGLANRDLEPFIGSRAKVSEVLSGKRGLSLQMIRALHDNLGIPAEALLGKAGAELPDSPNQMDWRSFPVKEMAKRGWIRASSDLLDRTEEIMRTLISQAGGFEALPCPLFRKNEHARQNATMDQYALQAWCYMVLAIAQRRHRPISYVPGSVTLDFCRRLVRNSWSNDGPKLAKELLEKNGIQLIHLPHLPHTHLDGAALQLPDGSPVIAVTLRYDRLDNFWFCLCHELAHVALHMKKGQRKAFIDDLNLRPSSSTKLGEKEEEADKWAQNVLIPQDKWTKSNLQRHLSVQAVLGLAQELRIHPAIVAGRVRKENNNYRLLTHFVGHGEVSKHFPTAQPLA